MTTAPAPIAALATRRGDNIVVPRSASLPAKCFKCGAVAAVPWRKKFYWHAPWLYLLILFPGLLVYAIVAMIVRKQMELNLPLCDAHHADRKRYVLISILMFIGFIPSGILLGTFGSDALGWTTGTVMFLAACVFLHLSALGIRATKIDDIGGSFRGAGPEFMESLPQQP